MLRLTPEAEDDLKRAAGSALYLVDEWPRVRDHLNAVCQGLAMTPIGSPPVLSAPIIRVLCAIVAQRNRLSASMVDRFVATSREKAVLAAAAAGETKGSLLDWPILGGLLYRIADELNVGGVPHAGNFHRTAAEGGAFRLLCRLLLEHVDVAD
jgi:hypothetical protein